MTSPAKEKIIVAVDAPDAAAARKLIEPLAAIDAASDRLLHLIDDFITTPADEDWNGVFDHREK